MSFDGNLEIKSAFGAMTLALENGVTVLKSLSDADNKVQFASSERPLWEITLLDRERQSVKFVSGEYQSKAESCGKTVLSWTLDNGLTLTLEIKTSGKYLSIQPVVRNVPEDLAIKELSFPAFDWLPDRDETSALVIPSINGLRYTDPLTNVPDGGIFIEKKIRDRGYPHGSQNMQFLALEKQGMLCYFAAHDPEFGCKHFNFQLDRDGGKIKIFPRWETPLLYGEDYTGFDWVFKIVPGDWFDAAMIHRDWALDMPHLSAGPLEESNRVPKWLMETPLSVLRHDRGPGYEIEHFIRAARELESPMLIRYYMWQKYAFDKGYPFFFPASPNFRSDIAKCREAGIRVVPYMNFYSADINGEHFDEISHAAVEIDEHGSNHTAIWSQLIPLRAMCPAEPVYRHLIKSELLRMVELGADGLYLDEYGMSPTQVCYSEKHGHVPGDPKIKHDGFASIVREIKAEAADINPELIVGIETYAENYIQDADVFISGQVDPNFMIPLFQAVYHDFAFGGFGRNTFPPDVSDPAFAGSFMSKQALEFIYGCQFGVLRAPLYQVLDSDPEAKQLMKTMCKVWQHSNRYLAYGRMLRPLDLDVPELEFRWAFHWRDDEGHLVRLPQVLNSVWQVNDGSVAVVLLNIKNEPVTLKVDAPGVYMGDPIPTPYGGKANYHYPIPAMTGGTLRIYEGSTVTEKMAFGNTQVGFTVDVPALGCTVLLVTSEKDYHVHGREFSLENHGVANGF